MVGRSGQAKVSARYEVCVQQTIRILHVQSLT